LYNVYYPRDTSYAQSGLKIRTIGNALYILNVPLVRAKPVARPVGQVDHSCLALFYFVHLC